MAGSRHQRSIPLAKPLNFAECSWLSILGTLWVLLSVRITSWEVSTLIDARLVVSVLVGLVLVPLMLLLVVIVVSVASNP